MKAAILTADDTWDHLDWTSEMEKLAEKGVPVPARGRDGLGTNIWYHNCAAMGQ